MSSDTASLHHHVTGPAGAPLLVLGPSLGTSAALWEPQLDAVSAHFRVLRFDLPGHGGSPASLLRDPAPGRTTVADLAGLVLDVVSAHDGPGTFHYAGISLGGAIGAHLAAHYPRRVRSLALVCSSAHFGEPGPWHDRAALVRAEGMAPVRAATPPRWFADPETAAASARGAALLQNLADTDPAGYAACCDALAAYNLSGRLDRITAPTLVVGGDADRATPLDHAEELTDGIPRAVPATLPAGHLAFEAPDELGTLLARHLHAATTDAVGRVAR